MILKIIKQNIIDTILDCSLLMTPTTIIQLENYKSTWWCNWDYLTGCGYIYPAWEGGGARVGRHPPPPGKIFFLLYWGPFCYLFFI